MKLQHDCTKTGCSATVKLRVWSRSVYSHLHSSVGYPTDRNHRGSRINNCFLNVTHIAIEGDRSRLSWRSHISSTGALEKNICMDSTLQNPYLPVDSQKIPKSLGQSLGQCRFPQASSPIVLPTVHRDNPIYSTIKIAIPRY